MDDIVKRALIKWPDVPHCFGWLGLDARGQWYMRDEHVQALGNFASSKGKRLEHTKLVAFISRNYQADALGQWFFQNGPQRVYVELELSPWVWRIQHKENHFELLSHTGLQTSLEHCFQDEKGLLYLKTALGFGLVHTMDMWQAAQMLELGPYQTTEITQKEMAQTFGFVLSPMAHHKNH